MGLVKIWANCIVELLGTWMRCGNQGDVVCAEDGTMATTGTASIEQINAKKSHP